MLKTQLLTSLLLSLFIRGWAQPAIIVTEVNYNSENSINANDWFELHNPDTTALNIGNWIVKDMRDTNIFNIPAATIIPAGGYLVLARDTDAFRAIHPSVNNVMGNLGFSMGNSGDMIRIWNAQNQLVQQMAYIDSLAWPRGADGWGRTLELLNYNGNLSDGTNWFDGCIGGSPGSAFSPCNYDLVFSEINYNSSDSADAGDWVELYNISGSTINLSGFIFNDEKDTLAYSIPMGTMLNPGDYLVLFGNDSLFSIEHPSVTNKIGPFTFGLSGKGEAVRLYNNQGKLIQSVVYNDKAPWPILPDGGGYTLELDDSSGNMNDPQNWFAGCLGGSPGGPFMPSCAVAAPVIGNIHTRDINISIAPNPASNTIRLTMANNPDYQSIEIINMQGRLMLSRPILGNQSSEMSIDITALPAGLYQVWMKSTTTTAVAKMMIVK